jgi:flagellar basal body rod protein FlgG
MDKRFFLAMRVAGQLSIAGFVAVVVYLGAARVIVQVDTVSESLRFAAAQPDSQRIAAYLTPLDRATLSGARLQPDSTGVNTDLAIDGKGFFQVKLPHSTDGHIGYTRMGSLMFGCSGDLLDAMCDGCELTPRINIPQGATDVSILPDGTVRYMPRGGIRPSVAGRILLAHFDRPHALKPVGGGIFTQTQDSGPAHITAPGQQGTGSLVQGFLEQDTINAVQLSVARLNQ